MVVIFSRALQQNKKCFAHVKTSFVLQSFNIPRSTQWLVIHIVKALHFYYREWCFGMLVKKWMKIFYRTKARQKQS